MSQIIKMLYSNSPYGAFNDQQPIELDLNLTLQEFEEILVYKFKINKSDYSSIEFFFEDTIYNDFELTLTDIGIVSDYIILVDKIEFPTYPLRPMNLHDRDHYREYKDGIRFVLSLQNKLTFVIEQCFADTQNNGLHYIEIVEYLLSNTESPIEIDVIQYAIRDIKNLTHSYTSQIKSQFEKLKLL